MATGRRRQQAKWDPREGMCPTHDPQFEWFPDYRTERGERQERCAVCLRWFWPDERGHNFVSTGESDTD